MDKNNKKSPASCDAGLRVSIRLTTLDHKRKNSVDEELVVPNTELVDVVVKIIMVLVLVFAIIAR